MKELYSSAAGHDRHSLQAEAPYADFIQGRGGLCVAKEVGKQVQDQFPCRTPYLHVIHMLAEDVSQSKILERCQLASALPGHRNQCAVQATLNIRAPGKVADIAVSGLPGWVSVQTEQSQGRLVLRVWAPHGIGAYLRPPLPVKSAASLAAGGLR